MGRSEGANDRIEPVTFVAIDTLKDLQDSDETRKGGKGGREQNGEVGDITGREFGFGEEVVTRGWKPGTTDERTSLKELSV